MAKRISVIVVNYNSGARLRKCMAALAAQSFRDFETIVVDNHSTDGSLDFEPPAGLDIRILQMGDNLGFAAANNRAAETAAGEWLAFLNPDAYPKPDWLEALLKGADRHPGVDAFGSLQLKADNPALIDGAGDAYFAAGFPYRGDFNRSAETAPKEGECFAPCAAAAFYRKTTFEALGGFEEKFFCYCEDVDLAFRLRLAGGRAVQLRDAVVCHEGSGITGRLGDFAVYHGHRNRLWTYFRNMPLGLLLLTLPFQLGLSFALIPYFAASGRGGAYLKAIRDGFAGVTQAFEDRRRIQAGRRGSVAALAKAMTWSPVRFLNRRADVRPCV